MRELAGSLTLSLPTIINAVNRLHGLSLLAKKEGAVTTLVKANRDDRQFIWLKRVSNLECLYLSGLVAILIEEFNNPRAIIVFGSYSRGEDIERSDIDIAIFTEKETPQNLQKYEKSLKRPIQIHLIQEKKISEDFKKNLYNGIVLEGSW